MDGLHSVMRSIRGETKSRRDHLSVFREFLNHLERAARQSAPRAPRAPRTRAAPRAKGKPRRGRK
jgi:hypothetical protein